MKERELIVLFAEDEEESVAEFQQLGEVVPPHSVDDLYCAGRLKRDYLSVVNQTVMQGCSMKFLEFCKCRAMSSDTTSIATDSTDGYLIKLSTMSHRD